MLNFDENRAWSPLLSAELASLISAPVMGRLVEATPQFIEDALALLFDLTDRNRIINATLAWIRSATLTVYHGTRLTDAEVNSVRTHGLLPLDASSRRLRLDRALSPRLRWSVVRSRLDKTLREHGPGRRAGGREGQVHLTLSRCGLVNGFNHYLTYGSEFDQRVAHALLEDDGMELLQRDGRARVIRVAVPGKVALNKANPYFTVDERLAKGQAPNLVNQFLEAWSYGLAHPNFDCESLETDCGLVFTSVVPASWIADIETISV